MRKLKDQDDYSLDTETESLYINEVQGQSVISEASEPHIPTLPLIEAPDLLLRPPSESRPYSMLRISLIGPSFASCHAGHCVNPPRQHTASTRHVSPLTTPTCHLVAIPICHITGNYDRAVVAGRPSIYRPAAARAVAR